MATKRKIGANYRTWTNEEVETLKTYYGILDFDQLCKRLKMPPARVHQKVKRLGLGFQKDYQDYVTMRQVCDMLNCGRYRIKILINYGLPVVVKHFGRSYNVMVRIDRLLNFLKKNPSLWDGSKVEYLALGYEPKWLKDKRRTDRILRQQGRALPRRLNTGENREVRLKDE